jgi:hypothetical protein
MLAPVNGLSDTTSSFDRISKKVGFCHICRRALFSTDSSQSEDTLNDPLSHELVISGIAHLLNNNSEHYKKFCLERCYDTDIHLRVTFMKAFARVLNLGTQFDQPRASALVDGQDTLSRVSHSA